MKTPLIYALLLCLCPLTWAEDLPEQFRQPFSESYSIRIEQYQSWLRYFEALEADKQRELDAAFQPDFASAAALNNSMEGYRDAVRRYYKMPPAHAVETPTVRMTQIGEDQYATIYRAWVTVLDGVEVYGLYMLPKGLAGKAPLIIAQHGGGGCPEAICDLDTRKNYDTFGPKAVRRGYIVWAPYSVMVVPYAGDSEEDIDRDRLQEEALAVDETLRGLEIFQIARSAEALCQLQEEIDADRVGMTGLSYGGGMTVRTMALTPLIKVGAPAAGFRGVSSRSGPGSVELAAAICPRPLMIQSGDRDTVAKMEDVLPGIPQVEEYYQKVGAADKFVFDRHDGGHVYVADNILDFFDQHLAK